MAGIGFSTTAFNPVIDGTWKNFVTDYGAPTNGTSACDAAVAAYKADPNPRLVMPPGFYNTAGLSLLTKGRSSAIISAYGATVSDMWIGVDGAIIQDQNHSARTNPVSAGTSSVTLKNAGLASLWSPGDWAMMCGLALANTVGFPTNYDRYEFVQVLSKSGATITFTAPLRYTYLDTWPDVNVSVGGTGVDLGGPAMLVALNQNWNSDVEIYGLSCPSIIVHVEVRNALFANCNFTGSQGIVPSIYKSIVFHGGVFGFQPEIDKLGSRLEFRQCRSLFGISIQSANDELLLHNVGLPNVLDGTFKKTTIQGNTQIINGIRCGPTGYGACEMIYAQDSTLGTGSKLTDPRCQIANMTWVGGASGTWKIARASNVVSDQFVSTFIPGRKLAFCFFAGNTVTTKDGGGTQTFTCTAVREDASFFYADTDIGPTLPTPIFQGTHSANYVVNWGADTASITEINSGPADITVFAAH